MKSDVQRRTMTPKHQLERERKHVSISFVFLIPFFPSLSRPFVSFAVSESRASDVSLPPDVKVGKKRDSSVLNQVRKRFKPLIVVKGHLAQVQRLWNHYRDDFHGAIIIFRFHLVIIVLSSSALWLLMLSWLPLSCLMYVIMGTVHYWLSELLILDKLIIIIIFWIIISIINIIKLARVVVFLYYSYHHYHIRCVAAYDNTAYQQ